MVHWIISDLPLISIGIFICIYAIVFYTLVPSSPWMMVSAFFFILCTSLVMAIISEHYKHRMKVYDKKLERLVIPEFIEIRPFKETNAMQKDEILAIILRNVNTKFISTMKKQYAFKSIEQLMKFHDNIIAEFTKRYFEKYKDLPLEDIQGWDRILLIAKNIQDEDLKDVYADMFSPEIIQKYSNIRPIIQENSLATNES